jgi:hypothetical protein
VLNISEYALLHKNERLKYEFFSYQWDETEPFSTAALSVPACDYATSENGELMELELAGGNRRIW